MQIMRWLVMLFPIVLTSCAGWREIAAVKENGITVNVAVGSLDDVAAKDSASKDVAPEDNYNDKQDTIEVKDLAGNRIVMNAVKDENTGEMVAADYLNEIVVQARFSNVAERKGFVDLVFELSVPVELQQQMWQVRLYPKYTFLGDTIKGDAIYVTGERFRKRQIWEYRMYNDYLKRIVPQEQAKEFYSRDVMKERFILRNGEIDNVDRYYRKALLEMMNSNRDRAKGKVYDRFVVDPFPQAGVRLDSLVVGEGNEIRYLYVQTIPAKAGMRRVDMVMEGEIHSNGRKLCNLASSEPITFYVSSISTFVDESLRYLNKVVYRDLHFEASYDIAFSKGDWYIDPQLGQNKNVMGDIGKNIAEIFENEDYDVDSILVAAACSPEGKIHVNNKLSRMRGESIKRYLLECICQTQDSLKKGIWVIDSSDETLQQENNGETFDEKCITVIELSEDWGRLYELIENDTLLKDKGLVERCVAIDDVDKREALLVRGQYGEYIKRELYPQLRKVKFNFMLHRKGMVKDTVHTTEVDTVYMKGVEALRSRDYKRAVELLKPYGCYNLAVAYLCLGYDNSALDILCKLSRTAKRDYMLGVVYGRLGDEEMAVGYFLNSVEQDESMRHRGNLDPEISYLIKKYGLFNN